MLWVAGRRAGVTVYAGKTLTAPLPPFFGLAQHFVGELERLERLGRLGVARPQVGMDFLGLGPPGLLCRVEIGIGSQIEHIQGAQLVAAAAAVARSGPAVMS